MSGGVEGRPAWNCGRMGRTCLTEAQGNLDWKSEYKFQSGQRTEGEIVWPVKAGKMESSPRTPERRFPRPKTSDVPGWIPRND